MTPLASRTWLNVALLAAVAVLAVIALWQPGIEPPAATPPLTDRAAAAVKRIRIERPDEPAVAVERREGTWYLTEPLALPANGFRLDTLLEVLEAKSDRRLDPSGLDLARFGLAPPKAVLVIDDLRFEFGDTEPLSGKRYVRLGEDLHLTADRFYNQLVTGAHGFVHLNPLGPSPEPVAIELPDRRLRLDGSRWVVEPDAGYTADAVSRLVEAWRNAQAITVRAYEPQESGRQVAVTLRDVPEPLRFVVVETPHALVLARPDAGVQYHLPTDAAGRLLALTPPPSAGAEAGAEPADSGPDHEPAAAEPGDLPAGGLEASSAEAEPAPAPGVEPPPAVEPSVPEAPETPAPPP